MSKNKQDLLDSSNISIQTDMKSNKRKLKDCWHFESKMIFQQ